MKRLQTSLTVLLCLLCFLFITVRGVASIFQRKGGGGGGSHCANQRVLTILSRFRHLNIVGCLLKKRLTKGGHGHPRRTPLATPFTVVS